MRLVLNIQYLRMSLLLAIFFSCLLLLSSESIAFSGTCNAGNIGYSQTYTCATGYTGTQNLFYSIETTTSIANVNYNIAIDGAKNIQFRNNNGFLGATISNLQIHYTDNLGEKGETGATGSGGMGAYELAMTLGYTGTIYEWFESLRGPVGATGTTQIVFATGSEIFSGAVFSLESQNDNAILNTGSTYFPVVAKQDGKYLVDSNGLRNLLIVLFLFFITFLLITKYVYNKGKNQFF